DVVLGPKATWHTCVDVVAQFERVSLPSGYSCKSLDSKSSFDSSRDSFLPFGCSWAGAQLSVFDALPRAACYLAGVVSLLRICAAFAGVKSSGIRLKSPREYCCCTPIV